MDPPPAPDGTPTLEDLALCEQELVSATQKLHAVSYANFYKPAHKHDVESGLIQGNELESEVERLSEAYAKLSCRLLCDTIQEKLPRELRDFVYEHLFDDDDVDLCSLADDFDCSFKYTSPMPDYLWNLHTKVPNVPRHVSSVDFLGPKTLEEVARMWYRNSNFVSWQGRHLDHIYSTDLWNVGLSATGLIRKLRIDIDYGHFVYDTSETFDIIYEKDQARLDQFRQDFARLETLNNKAVRIVICLTAYRMNSDINENNIRTVGSAIGSLSQELWMLQKKGYTLKVMIENSFGSYTVPCDRLVSLKEHWLAQIFEYLD